MQYFHRRVASDASGLKRKLASSTESRLSVDSDPRERDTLCAHRIVPIPSPSYTGPTREGVGPAAVVGTNSPQGSPGRGPEKTLKLICTRKRQSKKEDYRSESYLAVRMRMTDEHRIVLRLQRANNCNERSNGNSTLR